MDAVKEAFVKVKADIDDLRAELTFLRQSLDEVTSFLLRTQHEQIPTHPSFQPTNTPHIPTDTSTHPSIPTDKKPQYRLKSQYTDISTGNEGVPTNKPTNQQTNQHIQNEPLHTSITNTEQVAHLLASLDSLKKEVRIKFKRLTQQEMMVFAAVYELQQRGFIVDYPLLSQHLKLTEISIRDYTRKLIQKGIPLLKNKENNKKVTLSIAPELTKIASLDTIFQLREL